MQCAEGESVLRGVPEGYEGACLHKANPRKGIGLIFPNCARGVAALFAGSLLHLATVGHARRQRRGLEEMSFLFNEGDAVESI
jgi:hypothetical protein